MLVDERHELVLIKLRDELGRCVLPERGMHKGPRFCSATRRDENSFLTPERQSFLDDLSRLHPREFRIVLENRRCLIQDLRASLRGLSMRDIPKNSENVPCVLRLADL